MQNLRLSLFPDHTGWVTSRRLNTVQTERRLGNPQSSWSLLSFYIFLIMIGPQLSMGFQIVNSVHFKLPTHVFFFKELKQFFWCLHLGNHPTYHRTSMGFQIVNNFKLLSAHTHGSFQRAQTDQLMFTPWPSSNVEWETGCSASLTELIWSSLRTSDKLITRNLSDGSVWILLLVNKF